MRCLFLGLLLVIVIAGLYLGHGIILQKAGEFLLQKDELKPADVIVVLGGEKEERVIYGVKLFKDGWARKDRIVMTGGPVVWKYTWAGLMKEQAQALGVPAGDILLADASHSTIEDAIYTKGIAMLKGYRTIMVVTSPYHSKRASIIFRRVFGPEYTIISAPAMDGWFRFDGWWKRSRDRDMVLSEFSKFIRLWLFGTSGDGPTRKPKVTGLNIREVSGAASGGA